MKNLIHIPYHLPGKIYRSPMPFAAFDNQKSTLSEYLGEGINTVVMLIEDGEDINRANRDLKQVYTDHGINVIHFPIVDFDTPDDMGALKAILNDVVEKASEGENIAVHCFAGRGRTGMFIALLTRIIRDMEGREAIEYVRQFFHAIETKEQEQIVIKFETNN